MSAENLLANWRTVRDYIVKDSFGRSGTDIGTGPGWFTNRDNFCIRQDVESYEDLAYM